MPETAEPIRQSARWRSRTGLVLAVLVALAMAVPASAAAPTWRTHGSASSIGGSNFVSEVAVGATFKGADAIRLRFRSPDGNARKVMIWYWVECANGKKKAVDSAKPLSITTKTGAAWTNVNIFKAGSKVGECYAEGGGWYPRSSKQLDVRLQSLKP